MSYDSKLMEKITHRSTILSDDVTIMTSSLRKVVCMFRIKFPTIRVFRIFPILRTDGMALFGTYLWNDPRITSPISLRVHVANNFTLMNLPLSKVGSLMKNAPMITATMIITLKNQNLHKDKHCYQ